MSLSDREQELWKEMMTWEKTQFSQGGNDFSLTYQKWLNHSIHQLNPVIKKRVLTLLDETLFHIHAVLQQAELEKRSLDNLLLEARVFHSGVNELKDMKKLSIDQLRFIAHKQLARQRITALGQGGLTGAGGILAFLADLPLMLAINLRTIQLIAMVYGYDMRKPFEVMLVLKLFHAISLPKELQGIAWHELFEETLPDHHDLFFYEGKEDVVAQAWIQQPLKQLIKLIIVKFAKKKLIQGVPIVGIIIGAGMNYRFASQIAESAHIFYQKRWLQEKMEQGI
ncbi:ABC transporter substrate-binding protein [Salipaludibacillus keqinensis]|uniref:ABC transporter substrate-binding protein n=1 Tax=Salipaludibacillus keqinensis TaxID=2045207 RepID=A0A323TJH9_9BACI|nr:EcsC family protein [Salipaludibacillus keqinensis]PYZ93757.1 ABC transporter substrate-binding protein [Salipaludibacillus keqinensis]